MRILYSAVLASTLLSGCASTTDISTRYLTDTAVAPAPSVLLVARTPEAEYRTAWESACADKLQTAKLTLVPSHKALPVWYDAGNDGLLTWAQQHNIDAILIADITGLLLAPPQIPPQSFVQSERGMGEADIGASTWSLSLGGQKDTPSPPPEIHAIEVQLIGSDGKTRWSGIAQTHEANDLHAIAKSQCRAIGKTLGGLRLLP